MSRAEEAEARFREGLLCSQAVFSTYAPGLGLDRETAVRIACGFGAGMGSLGEICGAASGSFMVIGLKYGSAANWLVEGRANDKENENKVNTYRLVREFADRFTARHGSIRCKDILGCDLSTPQGRRAAQAQNLFRTVCPGLVRDAAQILEEIL